MLCFIDAMTGVCWKVDVFKIISSVSSQMNLFLLLTRNLFFMGLNWSQINYVIGYMLQLRPWMFGSGLFQLLTLFSKACPINIYNYFYLQALNLCYQGIPVSWNIFGDSETTWTSWCLTKSPTEAASPTVFMESISLTTVIDAKEYWDVMTVDIPNAFIQAHMPKLENEED